MLTGRAMYIWELLTSLHGGTVADMVLKAQRAKLSSLWVKVGDGATPFSNIEGTTADLFHDLVGRCAAANIAVFGYHVPHCATMQAATDEVNFLDQTAEDFGLAGIVVDNEDGGGYFTGTAQTAQSYGQDLRAAMHAKNRLVVMSSNDIISAHTAAFATDIGAFIDVNAPQVYYGQSRSVDDRLDRANSENKVIDAPFFPVGAAFLRKPTDSDGGFLDPVLCGQWAARFILLVSQLHRANPAKYPGYGFWDWQEAPQQVWDVLNSTDVFVTSHLELISLILKSGLPTNSLGDILQNFGKHADCVPFVGQTTADLNLPGNLLVVVDERLFNSFQATDIVDQETLSDQQSRVWVKKGSRAWQSGAISIEGKFKLRETMVGMEDLPEPHSVDIPGMPIAASEVDRRNLRALVPASNTIVATATAYSGSCVGGDHYVNNCAHFLSDAFIRAGFDELVAGHSADHFITARCGTSAKRAIRARDMWQWFQSKATQTSSTLTRNTGMWALFQLDESIYWGGHVVILDTDTWTWHGTGFHPTWNQYAYKW